MSEDLQQVKVGDLGLAKKFYADCFRADNRMTKNVGTPYYKAPEIYRGDVLVTTNVDLWALGVILFEMLTGNWPFPATNEFELFKRIERAPYKIPK